MDDFVKREVVAEETFWDWDCFWDGFGNERVWEYGSGGKPWKA